jgi:hypothetical protein
VGGAYTDGLSSLNRAAHYKKTGGIKGLTTLGSIRLECDRLITYQILKN